jgi:cytochrome c biogenesis protein CcdA
MIDITHGAGINFLIAFLAGLLSFLSPCVLPLVPAYIGYLSGASVASGALGARDHRAFYHAAAFVLGFSVLFVVIGAALGAAQVILGGFTSDPTAFAYTFSAVLKDLLVRVGMVLLVIIAVRVADTGLNGTWRWRIGNATIVWPAQIGGVPQGYVRWSIVGVAAAVSYVLLASNQAGAQNTATVTLNAVLFVVLALTGAQPGRSAALVLGVAAAALNTAAQMAGPLASVYTPLEWAGVAVQAVLIFLVVFFVSRTTLFYQERRFEVSGKLRNRGYFTSMVMGAVFGAGWTPCTGPNLAIILALAGTAGSVILGAQLLATYALGLGIPFLLVGLMFGTATGALRRLMPYMGWIKLTNTALLLAVAVLLASGALQGLANIGSVIDEGALERWFPGQ